jgi:hypothetical protein
MSRVLPLLFWGSTYEGKKGADKLPETRFRNEPGMMRLSGIILQIHKLVFFLAALKKYARSSLKANLHFR